MAAHEPDPGHPRREQTFSPTKNSDRHWYCRRDPRRARDAFLSADFRYRVCALLSHGTPTVWVKPIQLADTTMSTPSGGPLHYAGVTFSVPWSDVNTEKVRKMPGGVLLAFRSDHGMLIQTDPPDIMINSVRKGAKGNHIFEEFNGVPVRTDYELERELANITPASFTLGMSKQSAIFGNILLELKGITLTTLRASDIFVVSTPEFIGFQYGQPGSSARAIQLHLMNNIRRINIVLGEHETSPPIVTQADINLIIQTLRLEPDAPAAPAR